MKRKILISFKFIRWNPFLILWRFISYQIRRKKISLQHSSIDAPIGILGLPNKITWNVENFIYAKIHIGNESSITHKNSFGFINHRNNSDIVIHFYGIDKKVVKSYKLDFLEVQKNPEPKPHLKTLNTQQTQSASHLLQNYPQLHSSFSLIDVVPKLYNYVVRPKELQIKFKPLEFSKVITEMTKTNSEHDISTLTNKLKDENRFLPQSQARPYHETIMESRWF